MRFSGPLNPVSVGLALLAWAIVIGLFWLAWVVVSR
jgi:hypothetical protein